MPAISSVKVIINAHSGVTDKEEVRRGLSEVFEAGGVTADITIAKAAKLPGWRGKRPMRMDCDRCRRRATALLAQSQPPSLAATKSSVFCASTLNHFAKDLKIPLELEGAADTLMSGRIAKVDVGEVNGHIFINNSSLGLYPTIVSERERRQRLGLRKWPAFLWACGDRLPAVSVSACSPGRRRKEV